MVAAPPPLIQSWADHEHAWRASTAGVEATSDGGRHWRIVLKTPRVTWLTRTSPTVGIVESAGGVVVTKDAGRHWYPVTGFAAQSTVGRGSRLYAANGQQLLQAEQWPPTVLHAGMTIPLRVLYTMDGNLVLRVKQLVSGGVIADVIDGMTPVQQLVYRDWLAYLEPIAPPPPPPLESWADRGHAWRGSSRGIEATSDGGLHWRVVFPLGVASGAGVDVLIRTSPRAGLASIAGRGWVTIDAGRHWYQATGGPTVPAFGRGDLLFGTGDSGIDQAVQWPPRRVRCTGRWVHSAAYFSSLSAGPRPRTICQQDNGVELPMRRVWTVPPNDGNWIVYGRQLADGELQADVVDLTSEAGRYIGSVYYRNGVATTAGFTPR